MNNYIRMFNDPVFWTSFKNTIYFVILSIIFQNVFGLSISMFLFYGKIKASSLWRSIVFFPAMLSAVMVGMIWRRIFMGDGLLNMILSSIDSSLGNFQWLGNMVTPIFVVILINTWQWTGYNMVLYYAGLQGVNNLLIESAKVDGANWLQTITKIVIPQLYKTISLAVILNIIGGFKVFDIVYIMTGGGPAHASEVITSHIYNQSFSMLGQNRMGYGSAMAAVLAVVVIVFAAIRIRVERKMD
ncbi:MAG: sugar ABC transporter permease [Actinobacteria bacterium]|nr:sugar ABC transporter permease [Actinomycetota bacterium]